jgi:hypothetical protein
MFLNAMESKAKPEPRAITVDAAIRTLAYRYIEGVNVLTTSVYPDDAVVMNPVRKSSQLSIEGAAVTFAERLWNGMLDWRLEQSVTQITRRFCGGVSSQ